MNEFIDYINAQESSSDKMLGLVAKTLEAYKKRGRLSPGFTEILCHAIQLNNVILIDWIISLRTMLNYAEVIKAIDQTEVSLDTAKFIIFNTDFVSRMIVLAPESAENIKPHSLKTVLLDCHPLMQKALDKSGLVELAQKQQWNDLTTVLDALPQNQHGLPPQVAVNLLTQIAEHCPDDIAVMLFKKLQQVSILYWPRENNPFIAAIKANKHQLMRTMSAFAILHSKQIYSLALYDDAVTVETLTILLQDCRGFYMTIPHTKINEEGSTLLIQKYRAMTAAFAEMPKNSAWQFSVLNGIYCGHRGWVKKFPEAFTEISLDNFISAGYVVIPLAREILIGTGLVDPEKLISDLLNNPNYKVTAEGKFDATLSYAEVAGGFILLVIDLSIEWQARDALLSLTLDKIKQYAVQNNIKSSLIVNRVCGPGFRFPGLRVLAALLRFNHVSIALRLCNDFDFDANHINGGDRYKDMAPLAVALREDDITLETFSAWLTAPKLSLELPPVHLQGLSAFGENKLSLLMQKKFTIIKKQLDEQSFSLSIKKNQEDLQFILSHVLAGGKKWSDVFSEDDLSLLLNKKIFAPLWDIIAVFNKEQRTRIRNAVLNEDLSEDAEVLKVRFFCLSTTGNPSYESEKIFLRNWCDLSKTRPLVFEEVFQKLKLICIEDMEYHGNVIKLENMRAFIEGTFPATLAAKQVSATAPLLSVGEQYNLDSVFLYVRDNKLATKNLKAAKYQSLACLLARADLYPNKNTISSIKNREDIAIDSVKTAAWNLTDKDIVNARLEQLIQLLNQKITVISTPRTEIKTEGAKSEKLIKQIIVTLAFRKLYLMLGEKDNLPVNGFDQQTQRPNYKNLQRTINKNADVLEELKMCHKIVSQYSSELGLSVFGSGEAKLLGDLIQSLENRSEHVTTNRSSVINYAPPRIGLGLEENL